MRAKSLTSIIENFEELKSLWEWSLENCSDTEMKARIRGVDINMTSFNYIYGAFLGKLILGHSDSLSRSLQNPELSAADGRTTAEATIKTLISLRNETRFDLFWENVLKQASRLGADEPKLPRKRKQPKDLQEYFGYGAATETEYYSVKDLYRKYYFEALDTVINCIKDRFDQPDFLTYSLLEQLLLKAAKSKSYNQELVGVLQVFQGDFDETKLTSQLQMFSVNFSKEEPITFSSIIQYLRQPSPRE